MASRLAQLAISARTVQPSPFRAGGSPQLSDALDAIVCRSFGVAPQASEAVLDKRAETITPTEEAAIDAAQNTVNNLNTAAALKEFPLSSTILHPEHDFYYYDRMRDGVHRSAQGIGRSWWKRFFQVRGKA